MPGTLQRARPSSLRLAPGTPLCPAGDRVSDPATSRSSPGLGLCRPTPDSPFPSPPEENAQRKSSVEVGSPGARPGWRASPRDAQGAVQSGALSGEDEKRGVPNPRCERGDRRSEARGPQSAYYGNPGSSVLIRSAPYLVPSLPGMTREGEEKTGKAPELDRGPHPSPHRAPPSYLVPKRSLRPWGCASYGPRGEAAASSGSRCAQMLAAVKSTKGLPVRAPTLPSLLPGRSGALQGDQAKDLG